MSVGWMDSETLKALKASKIEPKTPIISVNDKGVLHMHRPVKLKTGQVLSIEEIKNIPNIIRKPEAILFDTQDPALLYVSSSADKKANIVIAIDYALKGKTVNIIKTATRLEKRALIAKRYEIIKGKLE